MNADRVFDGIAALGRQIAEQRAADRQTTRDARNKRRRARYAATKHLRPARPAAAPVVEADEDYEAECRCHIAPPPCSFCESYDPDAEAAA